jgi:hypothetical protein
MVVQNGVESSTSSGAGIPNFGEPPSSTSAGDAATAVGAPPIAITSASSSQSTGSAVGSISNPTATSVPPRGSKSSSNAGPIAGAAVGAAVFAAIVTFLITYMFLRKKNQRERRHAKHRPGNGGVSTYHEKALPKDPSSGDGAVLAAPVWQKHLPQSADDKTIRGSVKTLFDQVELHVENFYRDSSVAMTENLQAELLRVDSPHLPESIVALLPRARSQAPLIKHCLLSYIVASISTDDNSVQSLLPADYATLPHLARASSQKKPGKIKYRRQDPWPLKTLTSSALAFDQALSQWRVLSAYLRPSPKHDATYLSQRDANVSAAATAFTSAFAPWASSTYSDAARRQNVADIFKSAADVGILIFSQPSSFVYQWNATAQDNRAGVVVVTPAFLKVADENANPLERPQTMIQMATQSI